MSQKCNTRYTRVEFLPRSSLCQITSVNSAGSFYLPLSTDIFYLFFLLKTFECMALLCFTMSSEVCDSIKLISNSNNHFNCFSLNRRQFRNREFNRWHHPSNSILILLNTIIFSSFTRYHYIIELSWFFPLKNQNHIWNESQRRTWLPYSFLQPQFTYRIYSTISRAIFTQIETEVS